MASTLDIVIIVCVVVGVLAFAVVVYILCWAYKFDRRNREGFLTENHKEEQQLKQNSTDIVVANGDDVSSYGHNSDTNDKDGREDAPSEERPKDATEGSNAEAESDMPYPVDIEMDDNAYPESVISEDVNSSVHSKQLGQAYAIPHMHDRGGGGSVASSMDLESYGYSLEAGSMATPMPNSDNMSAGLPVEPSPDRSDANSLRSGNTDSLPK